mmetsp:Transcript_22935/g.53674  ORF Transcript_22935/g.53674 Transcript_22935/m.53674 type:complete len:208 (-) Transcript_22935:450-1073(-)
MGFSTAGKPTTSAALAKSASLWMRKLGGVGSPALCNACRVRRLSRAMSTCSGRGPGRKAASANRDTRGTESSTTVATPSKCTSGSACSFCKAESASRKTSSDPRDMSTPMNFETMPSSTSFLLHESGLSIRIDRTPSSCAFSYTKRFPSTPAQTHTTVAPRSTALLTCCPSGPREVMSRRGTFASFSCTEAFCGSCSMTLRVRDWAD